MAALAIILALAHAALTLETIQGESTRLAKPPDEPSATSSGLQAQVSRLVARLDDDALPVRDEAQRGLIALGPAAMEHLPPDADGLSAELRHRLRQIRGALKRARAQQMTESSRVTLSQDTLPLREVLEQFAQQTGNRVQWSDDAESIGRQAMVKVDFSETPFWQALDQVLDQAQLSIYPYRQSPGLQMVPAGPDQRARSGAAAYAGPFRAEAVRVEASRDLRGKRQQALAVFVELLWEPRVRPIGITQPLAGVRAVDSRGRALEVADPRAEIIPTIVQGVTATELRLPFVLPNRDDANIAQLQGSLNVLLAGPEETFRFEGFAAQRLPAQQQAGDVRVSLESVRKNNELWEVRVAVKYDQAAEALESHRGWIFDNDCCLVDAQGNRIEQVGMETTRQTENEVGVAYFFDVAGGLNGLSLLYKTPDSILRSKVDYALQDIPLP